MLPVARTPASEHAVSPLSQHLGIRRRSSYLSKEWAPSWAVKEDEVLKELESRPTSITSYSKKEGLSKVVIYRYTVNLQRFVRGYLARKKFKVLVSQNGSVSNKSFEHAIQQAKRQRVGCGALLWHSLFCAVVFSFVYLTGMQTDPPARSVESVLNNLISVDVEVTTSDDVYTFIRALVEQIYSPEWSVVNNLSTECQESLSTCVPYESPLDYDCIAISRDSGFVDYNNRILFGLFVQQSRYESVDCSDDVFSLYSSAVQTLTCFRQFQGNEEYAIPSKFTDGTYNLNDSRVLEEAYTYYPDQSPAGFWTLLDVGVFNFLLSKTLCDIDELEGMEWIDSLTQSVCLILPLENRNGNGVWATVSRCFEFDTGGRVSETTAISSATLLSVQDERGALCLLVIYIIMILWQLGPELSRLYAKGLRWTLSVPTRGFRLALIVAHILGIVVFIVALLRSEDLMGSGLAIRERQLEDLPMLWQTLDKFSKVLNLLSLYESLLAFILLVMTAQTVLLFDFHPQLGFISKTLIVAMQDLSLFLFVYVLIILLYGLIGSILLGNDTDSFASLGKAMISLFFISLGQFDIALEVDPGSSNLGVRLLYWAYFLSYISVTAIIMLNLLLSLIIEAFLKIDQQTKKKQVIEFTVAETTLIYAQWLWFDWKCYYWPVARRRLCRTQIQGEAVESIIVPMHRVQMPLKADQFLSCLTQTLGWEEQNHRVRYELTFIFSDRIVDRLLANMRKHSLALRASASKANPT